MGSIEIAILRGVAKRHGNEPKDFNLWLTSFGEALVDIIHGLGMRNSLCETSYHRKKIVTYLLVKLLDNDASLKAFHSKWQDLRQVGDSCVPLLSHDDFFEAVSFLGLGTEFTSIMEIVNVDVQELMGSQLIDWVKTKVQISEDVNIKNIGMTTLFLASLIIAMKARSHTGQLLDLSVKRCRELLVLVTQENAIEASHPATYSTYCKCMKLMLDDIECDISSRKNEAADIVTPDVLYLDRLKDIIEYKNASNQAFTDLISQNTPPQAENLEVRISEVKSPYFNNVEKALDTIAAAVDSATIKQACHSLKLLLNVDANDNNIKTDVDIEPSSLENDTFIVTNCLAGYDESTVRLLTSMVKNPLGNKSYKEIIACFQSSPQCLALKSNLLLIMDIISQCTILGSSDMEQVELSSIAFEFLKLFWNSFILLTAKSKYALAKEIIFKRKDYSLLSKDFNTECDEHGVRLVAVDHEAKKAIWKFFEQLTDEDNLNDHIRAEFSHLCLLCPSLCLETLIANAFYNQRKQLALLLLECDYLLEFPYDAHQPCLFWPKFFDSMKYHFMKEDGKSVDYGMALILSLFEKSSKSAPFKSLINKGFDMFGESFSANSQSVSVIMKMQLRVLFEFSKSDLFRAMMPPIKLLSLCVMLSAKIDVSISSWQTDPLYAADDELLLDVFEVMLAIAAEQVTHLKQQKNDQFVLIAKWLSHVTKEFTWSTQLRFLPVLQQVDDFVLAVPACLADVCKMPAIFRPDLDLCYGIGTGLLAWQQCFVINSSLCPIHSLIGIDYLEAHEIKMFTEAWIVALARILPFSKTSQWLKLLETTKLLISDCKLYCPFKGALAASLPHLDTSEVSTTLGVVEVTIRVLCTLCDKEILGWCSRLNFVSLSKRFSEACRWLVSTCPEYCKAKLLSQAYLLTKMFSGACTVTRLIYEVGTVYDVGTNQLQACVESLVILCLELLGKFEKLIPEICQTTKSGDDESSDDSSTSSLPSLIFDGPTSVVFIPYRVLELESRLDEMVMESLYMRGKLSNEILLQKLSLLGKKLDEILRHALITRRRLTVNARSDNSLFHVIR